MESGGWTLPELTARVDAALRALAVGQSNGQVAEAPNGRAVRWYASIGLLRRPEQRGRVAYYGPAHLLELVAIKRLQATGLSLEQVQQRLQGRSDDEIAAIADLPPDLHAHTDADPPASVRERTTPVLRLVHDDDAPFWARPPAGPAPALPTTAAATTTKSIDATRADAVRRTALELDGVTLVLPLPPGVTDDDAAVQAALAAIMRTTVTALRAQGLLAKEETR